MKGDTAALKKAQDVIGVLRTGAEQRQQQQQSVDGLVSHSRGHYVHFVHDSVPEQTQLTEAFARLEVSPSKAVCTKDARRASQQCRQHITGDRKSPPTGQDHASPNTDAHSLVKRAAPDEESKGTAELMCTHCQGLFSPHSWERHLELGCPQEPAEQVTSEVESTGEQRN